MENDETWYSRASRISFTAPSSRQYHVRIQAGSAHTAANGTYQLRIRTNQCADTYEPDTTVAQAVPITLGDIQTRTVCGSGDVDWIRFEATAGMVYRFETINLVSWSLYPELTLYSSDGTTVIAEYSNWSQIASLEFLPTTSGTYYVRVRNLLSGNGTADDVYDLRVSSADPATCQDSYEPNDTHTAATPLGLDAVQHHVFCVPGDTDWLAFEAEANTVYRVETTSSIPNNDTYLVIYEPDATTVVTEYDGVGSFEFVATQTGNYYLQTRHVRDGGFPDAGYDIQVTVATCADLTEPNNSASQAFTITADNVQTLAFCVPGDEDWLAITATVGLPLLIETVNLNGVDTYLELYDTDGITLIAEDDNGSMSEWSASSLFFEPETSGTYYIRVREVYDYGMSDATYDLRVLTFACTDVYEPDNDPASAELIMPGTPQSRAFCSAGDSDWIAFEGEVGQIYTIETSNLSGGTDTYLELYDTDGITLLDENDDGNDTESYASRIIFEPSVTRIYYIQVREFANNGNPSMTYDISLAATTAP